MNIGIGFILDFFKKACLFQTQRSWWNQFFHVTFKNFCQTTLHFKFQNSWILISFSFCEFQNFQISQFTEVFVRIITHCQSHKDKTTKKASGRMFQINKSYFIKLTSKRRFHQQRRIDIPSTQAQKNLSLFG